MNIIHYFLIVIIIIFFFYIINYIIIKNKKIIFEKYLNKNNLCCFYAYYEKNSLYKNNLKFFLNHGILNNVDYYIIINGKCTLEIPKKNNIKVFYRENKGYDFGAYSYAIKKINKTYDYYFFINSSVRGPFSTNHSKEWTQYFLNLFINKNTKIVGTSINIFPIKKLFSYQLDKIYKKNPPYSHVQSMFFCIDNEYFNYLKNIDFFNEEELNNFKNINDVIIYKELGLSQIALNNNWNINSILPKYKNLDYRKINKDFNYSSAIGDPYFKNGYFGRNIDKYEVIFFKNNRNLD